MAEQFTPGQTIASIVTLLLIAILIISLIPFIGAWRIVGAGKVGVVTRMGAVNRVENPGFVWKIPLFESVHSMETRTQLEQVDASSASQDLQDVNAKIALNFHLNGEKAVDVYQNIGTDYKNRVIAPVLQEAFKATTAKFTASQLISQREQVKHLAYAEITERLDKYNIIVDDLNIVNFSFSQEFTTAIEQKVQAQQRKEQATIEAETALIKAQGEANAQKALRDNGGLSPEYLEFLSIQKWNGVLPLATEGNPFINLR